MMHRLNLSRIILTKANKHILGRIDGDGDDDDDLMHNYGYWTSVGAWG